MTAGAITGSGAQFVDLIDRDFARRWLVAPSADGQSLWHAESTPAAILHNVRVRLAEWPECEIRPDEDIAKHLDDLYTEHRSASEDGLDEKARNVDEDEAKNTDQDLLSTAGKAELVRHFNDLLFDALSRGASDLHVQPTEDATLVRFRIDGVLIDAVAASKQLAAPLVSRIKVMGGMDIAERRLPQDGRATVTIGDRRSSGRSIDLRISTLPTSHGERAVIRLLDTDSSTRFDSLDSIGMPESIRGPFLERAARVNGIVLVTGPTGSGKTTTLYATLRMLAAGRPGELNIMTVEDPIEYDLSGEGLHLSQSQVNSRKGVTFASGLRHILRQDPDVIMVGEIRDSETAKIAIQASLTGHLVFSTLHTNDAASAVIRLVDLGVERYLVGASLSAVLAQRLVRRSCGCNDVAACESCGGTGYRGRLGVFELLQVTEPIRERLNADATASELRGIAQTEGMTALGDAGRQMVCEGLTTDAELARVIQGTV